MPSSQVDRDLAAHRGVDHGEEGRRRLDEPHAPQEGRRGIAGEIADHAAAQGDDRVVARDAEIVETVVERRRGRAGFFVCSPAGRTTLAGRQPGGLERRHDAIEVERRDVLVAHHERPGRRAAAELAEPIEQPLADPHVVGLAAGGHGDGQPAAG